MNIIDLEEKEVFKKEDRRMANLIDERYLQINHRKGDRHLWCVCSFKVAVYIIIQKDIHLLMVLRCVEGNPIRAGLVNSAKQWLLSFHKERLHKSAGSLIEDVPIELPVNWDRYVDEPLTDKESERLRQNVNPQSPYGQSEWQIKVTQEVELEFTLRPIGRPKKVERKEIKWPVPLFLIQGYPLCTGCN